MKDSLLVDRRDFAAAALFAAFCCATSCSRPSGPTPSWTDSSPHQTLTFIRQLPGSLWSECHMATVKRGIDVYVVKDEHRRPVIVMLQGSGCLPLFTVAPDGTFHGTTIFEDLVLPRRSQFHFVIIEKQGVKALEFTRDMTREQQLRRFNQVQNGACSPTYFQEETEVVRAEDALAVVQALSLKPWAQAVFVVGHSEGSHVVAGYLRQRRPTCRCGRWSVFKRRSNAVLRRRRDS